jgi:hypothetical protein
MKTETEIQTIGIGTALADLRALYRDLSQLEEDLKAAGADLTDVREEKQIVWGDIVAMEARQP